MDKISAVILYVICVRTYRNPDNCSFQNIIENFNGSDIESWSNTEISLLLNTAMSSSYKRYFWSKGPHVQNHITGWIQTGINVYWRHLHVLSESLNRFPWIQLHFLIFTLKRVFLLSKNGNVSIIMPFQPLGHG